MVAHGPRLAGAALRKTLRSIATNPFLIPFALGFALSAVRPAWPDALTVTVDFVFPALEMLSATAFGVALFSIGVGMALRPISNVGEAAPMLASTGILKLIVHPVSTALIAAFLFDLEPAVFATCVILAATPTATNAFIMATAYGKRASEASAAILVSTSIAFFTLTALLMYFRADLGLQRQRPTLNRRSVDRQDLARVHDVLRVQRALDRGHHRQRRCAVLGLQILDLAVADPVLTGAGPAHFNGAFDHAAVDPARFAQLVLVVRVDQVLQVKVAVPDVPDQRRKQVGLAEVLERLVDAVRQPGEIGTQTSVGQPAEPGRIRCTE